MAIKILLFICLALDCFYYSSGKCPRNYIYCTTDPEHIICAETGIVAYGRDPIYAYKQTSASIICNENNLNECCIQSPPISNGISGLSPIINTMSCGDTVYGYFHSYIDAPYYYKLTTTVTSNLYFIHYATFMDTNISIYHSNGSKICDNLNKHNEAFQLIQQPADDYYIQIKPYNTSCISCGNYSLTITCTDNPISTPSPFQSIADRIDNMIFAHNVTSHIASENDNEWDVVYEISMHSQLIMIIIIIVFTFIIITSYIYSRHISINDFYRFGSLFTSAIHIIDAISDGFFSINIAVHPGYPSQTLYILLIASVCCIVCPAIITLFQLSHAVKQWKRNDDLGQWLSDNIKLLYIVSVITGSSFTGINLCSSNLFNCSQFDMPLDKTQLREYQTKRVYSTVFLENIPQLVLQTYFLQIFGHEAHGNIVYAAMTFSSLSIIIAILSMISQKNIAHSTESVSIQFDVRGIPNARKCRNRIKRIKYEIASLIGVNSRLLEITRPSEIQKGLRVRINIRLNIAKQIDMNIERIMNESHFEIAKIIESAWNLSNIPTIANVKYTQNVSQERRDNEVRINAVTSISLESYVNSEQHQVVNIKANNNKDGAPKVDKNMLPPKVVPVVVNVTDFGTPHNDKTDDEGSKESEHDGNVEVTTPRDQNVVRVASRIPPIVADFGADVTTPRENDVVYDNNKRDKEESSKSSDSDATQEQYAFFNGRERVDSNGSDDVTDNEQEGMNEEEYITMNDIVGSVMKTNVPKGVL